MRHSFSSSQRSARRRAQSQDALFRFPAYLVVIALGLSPLFWVPVPPLQDYLDHLARAAVLANRDPTAAIAANYVVHWRLVPNLAFDLVVATLAQVMPLDVAGRVFLALAMALPAAGAASLHRALFGRAGWWPLCSLLFVYNDLLANGFVAVLFTFGLALLAFSLWVSSESRPPAPRIALFAVIAVVLLFLHLFAFGIYGLLIASYEAGRGAAERSRLLRRAAALLQFAPACALWLLSLHNMGALYTAQGDLPRKLSVWLLAASLDDPPAPLDGLILLLALVGGGLGFFTRTLVLAPAMRAPVAVLAIAAILMPEWASGSWGADLRLPVALVFVLIGATRVEPQRAPRALAAFAAVGGLFFVLRVGAVTLGWRAMDEQFAEFRDAIRALPPGARMTTVESPWPDWAYRLAGVPEALQLRPQTALWHLDALAVIDRGAFITGLFTTDTPVLPSARNSGLSRNFWRPLTPEELWARERPPARGLASLRQAPDGLIPCCYDWPHTYDFVLWIDFGHAPPDLPPVLAPWAAGSYFHIYRVVPP